MTQEAAVPAAFNEQVRRMIREEIQRAFGSASGRNTSLSTGGRFTIKGGALVVEAPNGEASAYFGGVYPALPDGSTQPGMILRREDESLAMALYDPNPEPDGPGDYKQFLAIYDRGGRIIMSDDTSSGQGLARPYLDGGFAAVSFADFRFSTTSASFVTLADAWVNKQHPKLEVYLRASMDTAATTGEIRIMVNGVQHGATETFGFAVESPTTSAPVDGTHMELLHIEIQGRVTSASGTLRVEPVYWKGRQT